MPRKPFCGIAASRLEFNRGVGLIIPPHLFSRSDDACLQHVGSGQFDLYRTVDSRPLKYFTVSNLVPTLTENSPWALF
jgi:hypothetical protein